MFKKKSLNPLDNMSLPALRLLNEMRMLKDSIKKI